ncbi:2-succinyl-6-hydroxy-2,4-cyclohexadiene-1-carboxylate synthase [Planococcus salinus]|uniref:Putative 2-succinyl-6-hydroxy-2,4-cyclohexadiene-1-carboxylate synthase n=1 Tax=Planococcus salinus TaxID=1848460 RepID=A0A3M8P3J6_9BACL|nr:2-succinyl-6-hydroxy-2,4-cyclohexadiene-1-carboxylate synthase [Planococcus salinus]RNF38273.1 2-succinyl-6-hydroxy-2,4-cyclohexadiene-1-carboxylate synthase [Planococcus salinus]
MKVTVNGLVYQVEIFNEESKKTVVFLHGFTGSTKTWQEVVSRLAGYKVVLVDLIGHGGTESPAVTTRYSMEHQIADLDALFDILALPKLTLIGYSMGGRTALAYACTHPERLESLILESASPGLVSEQQRLERRQRDESLADRIEEGGVASFVDKWEEIPLFETQKRLPESVKASVRSERLSQEATGLANSLRGMGTGAQRSYWDCLRELPIPVLLVTGTLDSKFTAIAGEMLAHLQDGQWEKVDAGHAIHVEKPAEFATIVEKYLSFY